MQASQVSLSPFSQIEYSGSYVAIGMRTDFFWRGRDKSNCRKRGSGNKTTTAVASSLDQHDRSAGSRHRKVSDVLRPEARSSELLLIRSFLDRAPPQTNMPCLKTLGPKTTPRCLVWPVAGLLLCQHWARAGPSRPRLWPGTATLATAREHRLLRGWAPGLRRRGGLRGAWRGLKGASRGGLRVTPLRGS